MCADEEEHSIGLHWLGLTGSVLRLESQFEGQFSALQAAFLYLKYKPGNMPIPFFIHIVQDGFQNALWLLPVAKVLPWLGLIWLIKTYFAGYTSKAERNMHGKVILVTVCPSTLSSCINSH